MYNRYMRNDNGVYTRMSQGDPPPASGEKTIPKTIPSGPFLSQKYEPKMQPKAIPPSAPGPQPERDLVNRILQSLHLGDLDAGDLLVLLLLFLLFREKADEELLIALGLLLIL